MCDKINGLILLSVIIPTFNRDVSYLERSITSVLNQTYEQIEIIVIDDNETGCKLSKSLKDYCLTNSKIRYIKQYGNQGACAARNLGASNANGYYLGFLDDDDAWEPQKAEIQIAKFNEDIGLVFCRNRSINTTHFPPNIKSTDNDPLFIYEPTFNDLLIKNYIGTTSQAIIRRDCFFEVNGFDTTLTARQDYDLWLRISLKFRMMGVMDILHTHYTHQGDQITKSSKKSLQAYRKIYLKYKPYYKKNKLAKTNIFCRISKTSLQEKKYLSWLFYFVSALMQREYSLRETTRYCCDSSPV